ncbi:MAG: ester cyclase [Pseudomonadales bacterium]
MKFKALVLLSAALAGNAFANDAVETIRAFYNVADSRPLDTQKLQSYFSPAFVDHDPSHGVSSIESVVGTYAALAQGAPDSTHELAMVLPSGDDKAIVYWRYKGSNTNNLFGMPSKSPVRTFNIAGIEIFTVKGGKITDMWHVEEVGKLVESLTGE